MPANSKYRGECGHCSYIAHSLSAMEKHLKSHLEQTDGEHAGGSQLQSDGDNSDSENEACIRPDPEPEPNNLLWEEWEPDNVSFNFHRDVDDASTEHHMGSCDTDMQHFRDLYTDSINDSIPSPPPTQVPSAPSPLPEGLTTVSEETSQPKEGTAVDEDSCHQTQIKIESHCNSETESNVSLTLKLQCSDMSDEDEKEYYFCAHCDFKSEVLFTVQQHTMSVHSEGIKSVVEADSWECAEETAYEQATEEVDEAASEDMEEHEDNWEMVPDENHETVEEAKELPDKKAVKQEPVDQPPTNNASQCSKYSVLKGVLESSLKEEIQCPQIVTLSPEHIQSNMSVYKCEVKGCSEYFMSRDEFCHHVKYFHQHEGGQIFYCAYCRFAATDCNRVREHASTVHSCNQSKPNLFLTPLQKKVSFKRSTTGTRRFTCLFCQFVSTDQHVTIYHTYREHRIIWMERLDRIQPGFSCMACNLGILQALPKLGVNDTNKGPKTIIDLNKQKTYVVTSNSEGMKTRQAVVDYAHLVNNGGVCNGCKVCDSVINPRRRKSLLETRLEQQRVEKTADPSLNGRYVNIRPAVSKPTTVKPKEANSGEMGKTKLVPPAQGVPTYYKEHIPRVAPVVLNATKTTIPQGTSQPTSQPFLTLYPGARIPTTASPKSSTVAVCRRGCSHHQMLLLKNSNPAMTKVLLLHELNGKVIHAETPPISVSVPTQAPGMKTDQAGLQPKTTLIVPQPLQSILATKTPPKVGVFHPGASNRVSPQTVVILPSPTVIQPQHVLQSAKSSPASSQPSFSAPNATSTPNSTANLTATSVSQSTPSSDNAVVEIQDSAVSSTVNKEVIKIEPDDDDDVILTTPLPEYEDLPWDDTVEDNSYLYADQENLEWLGQSETNEEVTVNSFRRIQEEDLVIENHSCPKPGPRKGRPKKGPRKISTEGVSEKEVGTKEVRAAPKPSRPKELPPQPTRVSKRERKPNVKCLCEECRLQSLCRTLMLPEHQHQPRNSPKPKQNSFDDDQLPELVAFSGSGKKRKQWIGASDGPRAKQRSMSGGSSAKSETLNEPKSTRAPLLMDDPKLRRRPIVMLPDIMMLLCSSRR